MSTSASATEEKPASASAPVLPDEATLLEWKPRMGQLTVAEKIEQSETLKKQANLFFKRGDFKAAINRYAKVFAYVNGISVQGDAMSQYASRSAHMNASASEGAQIRELKIACWSNIAFCYVKMGAAHAEKALEYCDKVLAEDESHSKAQFRKAQAFVQIKHFDRAHALLSKLAVAEPKNAAVRNELKLATAARKQYEDEARAKSSFNNIFNKKGGVGLY